MTARESVTLPDGRTLTYATYGDEDGAPLVFHHGTPGSRVLGALLSDAARERGVRVVAPDRPGFGGSDPHPEGTPATWADDCAALADHLGLDSFAVAGFSGGGPYALGAADQFSDRVTAVGVVGSPVPESDSNQFGPLIRFPRLLGLSFRAGGLVARYRGPAFVVEQLTDESVSDGTASAVGRDFRTGIAGGASGAVRESRHLADGWSLPTPDVPVRVWHGTDDENVLIDPVKATWDGLAGVSFADVEADHLGSLLAVRDDVVGLAK